MCHRNSGQNRLVWAGDAWGQAAIVSFSIHNRTNFLKVAIPKPGRNPPHGPPNCIHSTQNRQHHRTSAVMTVRASHGHRSSIGSAGCSDPCRYLANAIGKTKNELGIPHWETLTSLHSEIQNFCLNSSVVCARTPWKWHCYSFLLPTLHI